MRSICGKSSAKPVTVVDENVISDLLIQMFGVFLHCVTPLFTNNKVASKQRLVIEPKLQSAFLKLQPVWTPLIKKSAGSGQMPDNHKPHDENDKFFLVVQ